MRTLVLGGSVFLSRAVAEQALRRGHEVVCASRGQTGTVPEGARLVTIDRDAPDAYRPLAGEDFDAVVDVATISYPWVEQAIDALGQRVRHWSFVSSVSVYSDGATLGQRTDAPVLAPRKEAGSRTSVDPEQYGAVKVASEDAVRAAFGDRGFVVRPGLITGPGDRSDRFGYWPARLSRGGRVLVPADDGRLAQYIDVRDLAAWLVLAGEQGVAGTYDAIGPARPLGELLREMAEVLGGDVELVPMSEQALVAAGVGYWAGPKSLPMWVPAELAGLGAHDPTESLAAGLSPRPLADAVAGALATERELGLDRDRKAGLSAAEEAEVLATLG